MDFIAPALAKVYTTVRAEKGERAFNVIYIPWISNADDADDAADAADAADAVADAGSEHAEGGGGSGGAAAAEQTLQTLDATKEAEFRAKPVNKIINLLAQNVLENTVKGGGSKHPHQCPPGRYSRATFFFMLKCLQTQY